MQLPGASGGPGCLCLSARVCACVRGAVGFRVLVLGHQEGCWDSAGGLLPPYSLALVAVRLLIWLSLALSREVQKNGMWWKWGYRFRLLS